MRQRFLAVTPKGERALARCLPLWRKAQKEFVTTIGAGYWTDLRNELERLARVAARLEPSRKHCSATAHVSS
jgi:DNA-binding MarR family transcriptional regulator